MTGKRIAMVEVALATWPGLVSIGSKKATEEKTHKQTFCRIVVGFSGDFVYDMFFPQKE